MLGQISATCTGRRMGQLELDVRARSRAHLLEHGVVDERRGRLLRGSENDAVRRCGSQAACQLRRVARAEPSQDQSSSLRPNKPFSRSPQSADRAAPSSRHQATRNSPLMPRLVVPCPTAANACSICTSLPDGEKVVSEKLSRGRDVGEQASSVISPSRRDERTCSVHRFQVHSFWLICEASGACEERRSREEVWDGGGER